jgi:intracellular septation protein
MSFLKRYLNRRFSFEIAPGIIFFIVNYGWGLMWATAAVMVATAVFTFLGIAIEKRIPVFPIVTIILVLALGGATLVFEDELFIKVKPTVGLCLFAIALIVGLLLRPTLLARALEGQVHLTEKGWRVLTTRWVLYALALAVTNELIWRTQGTDTWVAFKASLTPVSILGYIVITRLTAQTYWQKSEFDA